MRVIIIEDEAKVAKELKQMLLDLDENMVIEAVLPSVATAVNWLTNNTHPDIIFSDIQLQDGLSFDIFSSVKTNAVIVFCTAYDQYAMRSFDSLSIDYLMKPIDSSMLQKSLKKYADLSQAISNRGSDYPARLDLLLEENTPKYKSTLLIHFRENILPLRTENIHFFYANEGQVSLYTDDGKTYSMKTSIEQLESQLDPINFYRANRKFIINRFGIKSIEHYFHRKLVFHMKTTPPEIILIGKMKTALFLKWLEI